MQLSDWRPIAQYDGIYSINKEGVVRNDSRYGRNYSNKSILTTRCNNDGYIDVRLSKDGKTKTTFIHILLAQAFIPNPDNKPEVNHINGIKTDNRLENLEWVTHAENMRHAAESGLLKRKGIRLLDSCTGETFDSISSAAKVRHIPYSTLKNMLNGNRNNTTCLQVA